MTTGDTSLVRRLQIEQKGHQLKNRGMGSWDQQIPLAGTVPICFFCFKFFRWPHRLIILLMRGSVMNKYVKFFIERKKRMLKSFAWLCKFFYLTSNAKGTLCAGVEPLFVFLSKKVQLLGLRAAFCLIQRNHTRKTTLRPFDTITPNHDINCLTIYGNATLLTRKPVVTLSCIASFLFTRAKIYVCTHV